MRSAFVTFALAAIAAADPFPGAVSGSIAPKTPPPAGCSPSFSGDFEIQDTLLASSKRGLMPKRDTGLYITLQGGVLKDSLGRTGYIAANQQFQFDKPPQAGAIYTAGFTVCGNGSLALGDDAIWYSCLSGSFSNLYYESQGAQCKEVTLQVVPTSGSATTAAPAPPGATPASTECTEYVDGQPQCTAVTAAPACTEYVDGQPQCSAVTAAPACTEYVDGQPQCSAVTAPPAPACTEYVDGQPQCTAVPAAPACTEYVDGQPQCSAVTPAPPAPVCSEYSDGQPQCSTATPAPPAPVCSEYVDGQPQCATTAAPVCSEYVDGQPQCATATPTAVCSEYVDGQPQCSGTLAVATSTYTGAPIATGAANNLGMQKEMFGLAAAGVFAVAML